MCVSNYRKTSFIIEVTW